MKMGKVLCVMSMFLLCGLVAFAANGSNAVPAGWQSEWDNPGPAMRPLQIVHGTRITDQSVSLYRDRCGLGGVVMCVQRQGGYVQNDENWTLFLANAKKAIESGLRVWIYDELAWPSLSAGGAVLAKDPTLESLELVYDPDAEPNFYVRKSYEYTFASMDSLRQALRHPNPLNPKATETFLDVTHRHYRKILGPQLYRKVEAFFTDEPTLLAISILSIKTPEEREKAGVADPLDWSKKMLPAVPWCEGLEERYKAKYGEELRPNFISLFKGDTDRDRKIRRQFWQMIAEVNADSYYGTIRRYCESVPDGPVASGHTLGEEGNLIHCAIDGNKLEVLKEFQLPGQDLLTSNPQAQFTGNVMTSAFPASAAYFIGQRRVMTEISDHIQRHANPSRMASLEEMYAAAGIMASWGVTEFTLYYAIDGGKDFPQRNPQTHHKYCDFVGRLNAVLRDAQSIRPVLLYYPIECWQSEYMPVKGHFQGNKQTKTMQASASSFTQCGQALMSARIPFVVVDDRTIREMIANDAGTGKSRTVRRTDEFCAIVYPKGTPKREYQWKNASMAEFYIENRPELAQAKAMGDAVGALAGPRLVFQPAPNNKYLAEGAFCRDGRFVFPLTNAGDSDYSGTASLACPGNMRFADGVVRFDGQGTPFTPGKGDWTVMRPATGDIETVKSVDGTHFPVAMAKGETIIVVSPAWK